MKRVLVWDLPTRLFHWMLAAALGIAFVLALTVDDESATFVLHIGAGLVAVFLVALRVVWGFVGSRYARFRSFAFGPSTLARYLRGAVTGGSERFVGHNPATSWAAIAMFALVVGLGATGVLMSGGSEWAEEIHEVLAWTLVAVVGAHVAGVAWHTLRHRDNIALEMVHGRKPVEPDAGIRTAHPLAAVALVGLTGAWAFGLASGYDAATGRLTLPLLGTTLQVGEGESVGGDGEPVDPASGRGAGEEQDDEDRDTDED